MRQKFGLLQDLNRYRVVLLLLRPRGLTLSYLILGEFAGIIPISMSPQTHQPPLIQLSQMNTLGGLWPICRPEQSSVLRTDCDLEGTCDIRTIVVWLVLTLSYVLGLICYIWYSILGYTCSRLIAKRVNVTTCIAIRVAQFQVIHAFSFMHKHTSWH